MWFLVVLNYCIYDIDVPGTLGIAYWEDKVTLIDIFPGQRERLVL
jgi:hypothetical protein